MNNLYLQRYGWPGPILTCEPEPNTKLIVVIPCFDEPQILDALEALYTCERPACNVEIIVVINHAEDSPKRIKNHNQLIAKKIDKWAISHKKEGFTCYTIKAFDLPKKIAGVGLARKIGMDEAVRRFEKINEPRGVIICFDADCQCQSNYLLEIYRFYQLHNTAHVVLVYFEHPLTGDLNPDIYQGIINYELHLRYYKNALKFAQFPYSYHTIGSCITVTSEAYQKQNGMNKRKAGEDFYFLQKLFPLGHIYTINSTTVYPSPRASDRVPFGTGNAIEKYLRQKHKDYFTYNPNTFIDLKIFMENIDKLYHQKNSEQVEREFPLSIVNFLSTIDFKENLLKIINNCSSSQQFIKAFFQWFNGFIVLKYVHFARDNYYQDEEVLNSVNWILDQFIAKKTKINDKKIALDLLRQLDRSHQ